MRVSLNTIKQYTDVDISTEQLVAKINSQLGRVEEITDLGAKYKDALIVAVAKCEKHPDAERLSVCLIDDGGVDIDVERDEDNLIQVVCGASNVRAGMLAVWLPPKSVVPATYDDKQPFVLSTKELRGVMSNGMLAAGDELALGSDHEGIVEITKSDVLATTHYSDDLIGKSFAEVFRLDDTIIDIENKMFTHRPDLFGQIGVAREIAGIQHKPFTSPEWYKALPEFNRVEGLELTVKNDASSAVPRLMAVAIKDVCVKPSPLWLQAELVRLGSKPINNIVDVTNYLMLLTGQPLHAYDYDKLAGQTLGVRLATEGEAITLLNGKTYNLTTGDVVIVDGNGPVGLGGVMGGGESEVSAGTRNIVVECANFDMYTVRKTSMRHGLFTEAVTRFNKGQSVNQIDHVLALALMSINDVAGGEQASEVFDDDAQAHKASAVSVTAAFINERLGLDLKADEMKSLLENVEFGVEAGDSLLIIAPFWRTDIEIAEDVVEEVGRLYGFDKLPRVLPQRSIKPVPQNSELLLRSRIRQILRTAGANEVLTYSFVHEKTITKATQNIDEAYRLSNALSPDLQYYRLSILPSLLDKVHATIKGGHDRFALFELGTGHNTQSVDKDGLPAELDMLELVYASKKPEQGAAYFRAQRLVLQLAKDLGLNVSFETPVDNKYYAGMAPFDLARSSVVADEKGTVLGIVGELKQSVISNFKLPAYVAAASLSLRGFEVAINALEPLYLPLSRFPKVTQDISLKVALDVTYGQLYGVVYESVSTYANALVDVTPVSIYQPATGDTKTITLRLTVASYERTLTDRDVNTILDEAAAVAHESVGAGRI